MLKDGQFKKVVIICGYVDMRKGIDGLSALLSAKYGLKTTEKGTLFLACGRKASVIRGLLWEGDGFVMITKRLSLGRFKWPRNSEEARLISQEDFLKLMEGCPIKKSLSGNGKSEKSAR